VLEAIDADVIKTYVRIGLGVGILAEIAVRDEAPGGELVSRPVGHLFGQNVTRIAFKRGAYLRNFVYSFAETLSDRLSRALIVQADVSRSADVARLAAAVADRLGDVGVLVNNAGVIRPQPLDEIAERDWNELIAVNLTSVFLVTQPPTVSIKFNPWCRRSSRRFW